MRSEILVLENQKVVLEKSLKVLEFHFSVFVRTPCLSFQLLEHFIVFVVIN